MRKEVLWAIAGGIILGLVVAFGVYRINSTISSNKKFTNDLSTPTPTPSATIGLNVVLDKPEEDVVLTQSSVKVSGLTSPNTWVIFSGEDSNSIVQSDKSGGFSQSVDLVPGVNQIKVTVFGVNGEKNATEVLVVYSPSFEEKTSPTASPASGSASINATGEAAIRQKIAQDLAKASSKPKAYIGTVTDITDSTIEIKDVASQIKQISDDASSTTVIDSTGTTNKTVKTTDIAIGDFIVAMGYVDANSVLISQRILITSAITEPKINISEAKVTSVVKKILNVSNVPDGTANALKPDSKTTIEVYKNSEATSGKLSDIHANDLIIYVSTRSIFLIQKSQS